jgi:YhcH/YjgK/YiaL family protein
MVVDSICNVGRYYGLGERVSIALKYLRNTDFHRFSSGRYDIYGDDIYAILQRYDTRLQEKGLWEAHRRYIDIHYIIEGAEQIGYGEAREMIPYTDYDSTEDCILFKGNGQYFVAGKGHFAIFWPQDVHMPCIAIDSSTPVVKAVLKVLL